VVLERVHMMPARGGRADVGYDNGGIRSGFAGSQMQIDSMGEGDLLDEDQTENVAEGTKQGLKRTSQEEIVNSGLDMHGGYEAGDEGEGCEGEDDSPALGVTKKKLRTADAFGLIEQPKLVSQRRLSYGDMEDSTLEMLKTCLVISNAAIPGSQIVPQWTQQDRHVAVQGLRICPVA